ncbi:glycosyltransferase family 2 protein [Lysobacter sp. A289]
MTDSIQVSAIIPTFNRRELVSRAIDSVLAQTRRVDEIVVVDDGSTDGTAAALRERFGNRVQHVWQANAGVSAARNHGMAIAGGRYFALLDSDDEWLPDKTARQLAWLESHPEAGMVLCDVARVDEQHREIDVFRRRDVIREDGWVLRWILHNPALVPASVMMRREVFDDIGGFDESLRTAEDIEYHLRVARCWQVGVVDQVLVRAMRGHDDGLSALPHTYDDYLGVMERAFEDARGQVDETERQRAFASVNLRIARGMLIHSRWADGWRLASRAWHATSEPTLRRQALGLLPFALKRAARGLLSR